jgi:hypothetical protein
MNQRITIEQLNELTDDKKEKLRDWWWRSNPGISDVYVVKYKYDDITRYEGPHVLAVRNNFSEDYHKGEAIPLLSIGQMIEFLQEKRVFINDWGYDPKDVIGSIVSWFTIDQSHSELADVLWEVVKNTLKSVART